MPLIQAYFMILLSIQVMHSVEEIVNGFYEKFPLFKMKLKTFLILEGVLLGFFITVLGVVSFPFREYLMAFFNLLMFANGIWHLTWWGIRKEYVPGLYTAPLFVIVFIIFYFQVIF